MDLTAGLIWELVSKTALVVALLYGVLLFARKFSNGAGFAPSGAAISLLQSVHLGPGRSVHLVSVGGRTLLIGSTSQHVSLLSEVGTIDQLPLQAERETLPFDRYLGQASETLRSLPSRLRHRRGGKENGD